MSTNLISSKEAIKILASKYGVSCEVAQGIIRDFINDIYYAITGREPNSF
jgi:hypothetical protein